MVHSDSPILRIPVLSLLAFGVRDGLLTPSVDPGNPQEPSLGTLRTWDRSEHLASTGSACGSAAYGTPQTGGDRGKSSEQGVSELRLESRTPGLPASTDLAGTR
jgi:hypothetical protein